MKQVWLWVETWGFNEGESTVLGVYASDTAAYKAQAEAPITARINSSVWGPFPVQEKA